MEEIGISNGSEICICMAVLHYEDLKYVENVWRQIA